MTLIGSIIRRAASRSGDRAAIITPAGWTVSFNDLDRWSDEVAGTFVRRGVTAGDPVVISLASGPEYAVTYLALAKLGAITAGVNPLLTTTERSSLIDISGARLVVTTSESVEHLPHEVDAVVVRPATRPDDVMADHRVEGHVPAPIPEDDDRVVAIVFTSGTTGVPKGATFGERQLRAVLASELADPWAADGHILSGTQFAHVGFMLRLHTYLEMNTTLCLMDRWRAADALELIERYAMPAVNGVSSQIALMLQVPEFATYDLSSVRRIVTGGGPSTPDLVDEATRRFAAPYTTRYSMTESGGMGTATSIDASDEERYHTVGRPRTGLELRIGRHDDPTGIGDVGEVCVRGPSVMTGYWGDPAATENTIVDGWLHTGDLGRIDDQGCLRLAGRSKEMYIRGGYNVYPQEVEAVLNSHPGVRSVVVVPRPDAVMGEIGVAVIVPSTVGSLPTLDELRRFGAERLTHFKLPEALRLTDALPVTSMQKVDRRALLDDVSDPSGDAERLR
ncbi:MAG: class I adenylate-forming enzyme family protein [Ilumatobacteraceae bacterium]|nr:class I adenylate-forming enzyme family protein [Ilumatobacteraceae bacterium]